MLIADAIAELVSSVNLLLDRSKYCNFFTASSNLIAPASDSRVSSRFSFLNVYSLLRSIVASLPIDSIPTMFFDRISSSVA